jgi:hypothetical protein
MAVAPGYANVLVSKDPKHAEETAYGPRLESQYAEVKKQLRGDPSTRQAVLTIWKPDDLWSSGDKPCTLSLQFILRRDHLELHTTMRSQDVWLGMAMDIFVFTQLQLTLAIALDVKPGKYMHHVGSFHAYERDWEKIEGLWEPDDYSLPANDLPRGVIGGTDEARLILYGARPHESWSGNPWYTRAIDKAYERLSAKALLK